MQKMFKKIKSSEAGFSLTEVMIGIMILTVAIVAATNLLISLIRTNEGNLKHIQAYYFVVEGIEAVRNIRDTNWLFNENWLTNESTGGPWGVSFSGGGAFIVDVLDNGAFGVPVEEFGSSDKLDFIAPFDVSAGEGGVVNFIDGDGTEFTRKIEVLSCPDSTMEKCKLIKSIVSWDDNEVILEEILTDWKGGAL